MDHITNGSYQLLEKDPTSKIKTKTLKQLKVLKDNKFIDNKFYYYLKPTDSSLRLDFMINQKYTSQEFLYVLYVSFLKLMSKMKTTTPRILPRFPTTSQMFPLKMIR